jgi:putative transposase
MKRIRFTEEQIIAVLREHEAGMDVSDAKRLRVLEDENRKLKKLLAESMLDQAALKELLTKKW